MFLMFNNIFISVVIILLILILFFSFKFKKFRVASVFICILSIIIGSTVIINNNNAQKKSTSNKKSETQQIGKLHNYEKQYDMKNVDISSNINFDKTKGKADIYILNKYKEDEILKFSENIFKNLNVEVNKSNLDKYENAITYYSKNQRYQISVNYRGMTYNFIDFKGKTNYEQMDTATLEKPQLDLNGNLINRENIEILLKDFDIYLPKEAKFTNYQNDYIFYVSNYKDKDYLLDGYVECLYLKGDIITVNNNLKKYKLFEQRDIISEEEAFEKIKQGQFDASKVDNIKSIVINDVKLDYELDDKDFYQPVYKFNCSIDNQNSTLTIPALK